MKRRKLLIQAGMAAGSLINLPCTFLYFETQKRSSGLGDVIVVPWNEVPEV